MTADRGFADDAAQEAFVKAFAALGRFDNAAVRALVEADRDQCGSRFPPSESPAGGRLGRRERVPHAGASRAVQAADDLTPLGGRRLLAAFGSRSASCSIGRNL